MGLPRELGSVEPSTTSGHPIAGPARSSWGLAPLHQLGCRRGPACGVYGRCLLDGVPQPGMRIARPRIRPWRRSSIASLAASKG